MESWLAKKINNPKLGSPKVCRLESDVQRLESDRVLVKLFSEHSSLVPEVRQFALNCHFNVQRTWQLAFCLPAGPRLFGFGIAEAHSGSSGNHPHSAVSHSC